MKSKLIEMPKPEEVEIKEGPHYSIPIAVAKLFIIAIAVFSMVFMVSAMTQDTTLVALEKNYASALLAHTKQVELAVKAIEMERLGADMACNNYKALKAYKESKEITLTGDGNPCVELNAPQEGF